MVNGSLEKWLHSDEHNGIPNRVLSFGQRICIAADVASALDYVHNHLTPPLIHCDLKPQNILLDDDMTARLSDFGSAKFLSPGLVVPKSLDDVGGTIGYMAPGESDFPISHLIILSLVHICIIQCITSL
jgi:serine/threonine protein kinase